MGMPIQAGAWKAGSRNDSNFAAYISRAAQASAQSSQSKGVEYLPDRTSGSLFGELYADYRRYRAAGARSALSVIALTQGFWASAIFRISHWALKRFNFPVLRTVINAICILLQKFIELLTGISIPAGCSIGAGLYIGHFGGIFVDSDCRIGRNCNLSQGVTIGKGGRGSLQGVPVVGDRVHVGANALLLGKITIGNDAVIGPGAVVMSSVPERGVAMGNPARVVGLDGSFEFVHYDDMEKDPHRLREIQPATVLTTPKPSGKS